MNGVSDSSQNLASPHLQSLTYIIVLSTGSQQVMVIATLTYGTELMRLLHVRPGAGAPREHRPPSFATPRKAEQRIPATGENDIDWPEECMCFCVSPDQLILGCQCHRPATFTSTSAAAAATSSSSIAAEDRFLPLPKLLDLRGVAVPDCVAPS